MSSPRDDRYYSSAGKSRRSPPAGDNQGVGFFQTGQGGRTVLPPLSSAFPTSRFPVPATNLIQYSQLRSSPGRYDYDAPLYGQWLNSSPAAQSSSYPYYESHDNRYISQPSYASYSSRVSPTIPSDPPSSRKLPPLSTSSAAGREERYQTSIYTASNTHGAGHIRSPTASYPATYAPYSATNPANAYSYPHVHVSDLHPHVPPMSSQPHTSSMERMIPSRNEPRSASPYNRSSLQPSPPAHTPPPVTPTSPEEPMIKKKRKRADAAQLKVLNETYNRTAFPSTEERLALAKALDMSARSVQIWFQNKRQSMRQTNRQSSTVSSGSHQPFSVPSQADSVTEDMSHPSVGGYGASASMAGPPPHVNSRSAAHATQQPSSHRGAPIREDSLGPRKWHGRY